MTSSVPLRSPGMSPFRARAATTTGCHSNLAENLGGEEHVGDSPTIKVCVRVRPFIAEEIDGERSGGKTELCVAMPRRTTVELFGGGRDSSTKRSFEFDHCYWSHDKSHPLYAAQADVYEEQGTAMLRQAMLGFNNCIFAYGQTGSGKSFTVVGGTSGESRGLLPRMVAGLFEHFAELAAGDTKVTCKCLVSFLEIYNETIRDLLEDNQSSVRRKPGSATKGLEVRQHPTLGTTVPGLREAAVGSCKEVFDLLEYGLERRNVSQTAMNATSSRSHCIFTFKTAVVAADKTSKMSQTHLVDLAGSERSKRSKAEGDRLTEGIAINKSLSTLARVISELSRKGQPPFRDSRLTFILKESLCGNSKTVMFAAISPNLSDYEESLSTLHFAQSAKKIETRAVCNEVSEHTIEEQLRSELQVLREQLQQMTIEKCQDVEAMTNTRQRFEEQQALVMRFTDWDALLQAERCRNMRRSAVTVIPEDQLQMLLRKHEDSATDSDSGSSLWQDPDKRSDRSSDDRHGQERDLMHFSLDDAEFPEAGSAGKGCRSSLKISGPAALRLRGSASETTQSPDVMTESFRKLRSETFEAERIVKALSHSGSNIKIYAEIAINPVKACHSSLVVCATRQQNIEPQSRGTKSRGSLFAEGSSDEGDEANEEEVTQGIEWLSVPQFRARLTWLQDQQKLRNLGQIFDYGDAWCAAVAACSYGTAMGLELAAAGTGERPVVNMYSLSAKVETQTSGAAQQRAEMEQLRAKVHDLFCELMQAQSEVAELRRKLHAVQELQSCDADPRCMRESALSSSRGLSGGGLTPAARNRRRSLKLTSCTNVTTALTSQSVVASHGDGASLGDMHKLGDAGKALPLTIAEGFQNALGALDELRLAVEGGPNS